MSGDVKKPITLPVKERPILFAAPMVRALLDGSKTQTRRVAKPVRHPDLGNMYDAGALVLEHEPQHVIERCCPYGRPGDRLWVRETTLRVEDHGYSGPVYVESDEGRACLTGGLAPSEDDCTEVEPYDIRRRPAIHMPRSMSRIDLEVTSVRVERLQDISEADAIAEGIERNWCGDLGAGPNGYGGDGWVPECGWRHYLNSMDGDPAYTAVESYRSLWQQVNGSGSWAANPWVWVVEFRPVEHSKERK